VVAFPPIAFPVAFSRPDSAAPGWSIVAGLGARPRLLSNFLSGYIGKTWGRFGQKGKPNKWVAYRALKLLKSLE